MELPWPPLSKRPSAAHQALHTADASTSLEPSFQNLKFLQPFCCPDFLLLSPLLEPLKRKDWAVVLLAQWQHPLSISSMSGCAADSLKWGNELNRTAEGLEIACAEPPQRDRVQL